MEKIYIIKWELELEDKTDYALGKEELKNILNDLPSQTRRITVFEEIADSRTKEQIIRRLFENENYIS